MVSQPTLLLRQEVIRYPILVLVELFKTVVSETYAGCASDTVHCVGSIRQGGRIHYAVDTVDWLQ